MAITNIGERKNAEKTYNLLARGADSRLVLWHLYHARQIKTEKSREHSTGFREIGGISPIFSRIYEGVASQCILSQLEVPFFKSQKAVSGGG